MTAEALKWLAALTMLIDHAGMLLFPQLPVLRMIGRIAFPIFAYQTAAAVRFTRSRPRYLGRLAVGALASELPFRLAVLGGSAAFGLRNVLFTLLLGALCCMVWDARRQKPALLALIPLLLAAAELLRCDYGAFGAAAVLLFFALVHSPRWAAAAGFAGLTWTYCLVRGSLFELPALLALAPICAANGQPGRRRCKYFFYVFYPAHLLVLWAIARA